MQNLSSPATVREKPENKIRSLIPKPENLPSFAALRRFIVGPQRMEHYEPLEVSNLARAA